MNQFRQVGDINLIKETLTTSSYSLGTIINLRVQGSKAEQAIEEAIERLNDIDDKMSAFKEDSEISKINLKAGVNFTNCK